VVDAEFASLAAPSPVAVGDVLRTDATGYAEVAYFDGSRTRLDVNTEFTVLELVDEAGAAMVRAEMGLGRTWHRVGSVGEGDGGFSVETSVATATVRGAVTITDVTCVAVCTAAVGDVFDRSYTFVIDCAAGVPCTGTVQAQLFVDGQIVTEQIPLTFDGSTYTWQVAYSDENCVILGAPSGQKEIVIA